MNVITTQSLTKKYKDIIALDEFNISIPENKIIGLIGKNGAGKTTLLKACAGRIRQTSGEVKIFGEKVFDNLDVLSKIVFVDEESQYDDSFRVKDIFALAACYYQSWDDDLAQKLIKHFALKQTQKYKKLSRGMKTQVNIIIGICARMPLTILDEPTLGLDAAVRKDFYNILLRDYMNHPRTIIISSHLLNEIEILLEDIVLIDKGKVLMNVPVEEFRNYSVALVGESTFLKEFVQDKEVLDESSLGNASKYVIKNEITEKEKKHLVSNSIDIQSVSSQDLFIYLTSKGGFYEEF
ncbi:MAG: ABC transporter ATP-binding protein [Clostridiales bacterium]|nr:ABC transporter ATP-binding protein [Clostridiales bacterium]